MELREETGVKKHLRQKEGGSKLRQKEGGSKLRPARHI